MLAYHTFKIFVIFSLMLVPACASTSAIIPEPIESRVDKQVSFIQVLQNPDKHKGKWLLLGGEVLHVQKLKAGTRLEILQLPLNEWQQPRLQRTTSKGRFFAYSDTVIDSATYPPETRFTLVGEITGSQRAQLDESEYHYPTFSIQHIHIWKDDSDHAFNQRSPHWSIFGGGGTGGRSGGGISFGIGF